MKSLVVSYGYPSAIYRPTDRILSEVSPGVKVEESEVDGGGWQGSGEHFGRNQLDETAGESMGIESSSRVALRRGGAGCEVVGEW